MNKPHSIMDKPPGDQDNFKRIKGIGDEIARKLHYSGIHRFSELALFTPQELVECVKDIVSIAPMQQIESDNWIGQARDLAKKKLRLFASKQSSPDERQLANFLVLFVETTNPEGSTVRKVIVNHDQRTTPFDWDKVANDELIRQMLAIANLPGHMVAEEPSSSMKDKSGFFVPEDELEEDVQLKITDLHVSQVTAEGQVNDPNLQKPVRVEGMLSLEGIHAGGLAQERVPFYIKFNLINLEGDLPTEVAIHKGYLDPGKLLYEFRKDFPVPQRGRYRLLLIAGMELRHTDEIREEGPVLRVGV